MACTAKLENLKRLRVPHTGLQSAPLDVLVAIGSHLDDLHVIGLVLGDLSYLEHFNRLRRFCAQFETMTPELAARTDAFASLPITLRELILTVRSSEQAPCTAWLSSIPRLSQLRELNVTLSWPRTSFNHFIQDLPHSLNQLVIRVVHAEIESDGASWVNLALLPPRLHTLQFTDITIPFTALQWAPLPSMLSGLILNFFSDQEAISADDYKQYLSPHLHSIGICGHHTTPGRDYARSEALKLCPGLFDNTLP